MACNQGQVCFHFNQITLKPNAGIAKVQKELKKTKKQTRKTETMLYGKQRT